jgi:DNA polymerase I
MLQLTLSDRAKYKKLLQEEKAKANPDPSLIEEYDTHQIGAKLFGNAGYGVFGNEYFAFANYKVAECITAEGRRILKQMKVLAKSESYNFDVVFGFTDSVFFKDVSGKDNDSKVHDFIQDCKTKFGVTPEKKNVFINSIFYGKKNRFVAWTGNKKEEPVIKGLDGLSDSNPLWVQKWFKRIVVEIVKHPDTRFEVIPRMIKEAFDELVDINNRINPVEELKFTQQIHKDLHEYKGNSRTATLAQILNKGKGELVHWYETLSDGKKSYSVKPENLNLAEYKRLLLSKLKDSLEITDFDFIALEHELLEPYIGRMTMFLPAPVVESRKFAGVVKTT